MKKRLLIFILLCFTFILNAQQSSLYSEFMLNEYGLNPAVAGSSKGCQIMFGRRTQWRGFDLAPESTFASIVKDFGKKGYKRYWHGLGAYFEYDRFGMFTNKILYGSYTIHLKISSKTYLSFGVATGIKTATINNSLYDINDPALANRAGKVVLYPDLIPGMYFYSRKLTMGIAVRNLYKSRLQQDGKKIGTPTKLPAIAYFTVSKKIRPSGYDYVLVPAIQIQSTFSNLPLTQFNFMAYYRKIIGIGLTYRIHDAMSAMIQIRIWDNIVIGFAYDYTISKFRSANANSTEFMVGYTPNGGEDYEGRGNVAQCPKFDF